MDLLVPSSLRFLNPNSLMFSTEINNVLLLHELVVGGYIYLTATLFLDFNLPYLSIKLIYVFVKVTKFV